MWDYKHSYQVIDSRGGGGLGMGFGHALGVALANKDKGRLTINIQSDGPENQKKHTVLKSDAFF